MSSAYTPILVGVVSPVLEIWTPFKNGQISLLGHGETDRAGITVATCRHDNHTLLWQHGNFLGVIITANTFLSILFFRFPKRFLILILSFFS